VISALIDYDRCTGNRRCYMRTPGLFTDDECHHGQLIGLRDLIEKTAVGKPLGRGGVPDDVARVVLFCASDLAAFMTGSTLPVDAGDLAV
jgi:NAD(P)-dependent dehydrogenase (short-subunit alcohol dehydrogenase family)